MLALHTRARIRGDMPDMLLATASNSITFALNSYPMCRALRSVAIRQVHSHVIESAESQAKSLD